MYNEKIQNRTARHGKKFTGQVNFAPAAAAGGMCAKLWLWSIHGLYQRGAQTRPQGDARAPAKGSANVKLGKTSLYATLKRKILTLELSPDQDLDEVALSQEYGISRTPVRDVLRRLAGEGYVDIRENRGARVIPMNLATLRDFFVVAPIIYEAVGRLAVSNFRAPQLIELKACQERFRAALKAGESEVLTLENTRFHEIIGEMADSSFLKPSLGKLLIDHARIGHTFFRPTDAKMEKNLVVSCRHHDAFIRAIAERDAESMVSLVYEHWELSRQNMELFVAPREMKNDALARIAPAVSGEGA